MKHDNVGVNDTARGMPLTDASAMAVSMDMINSKEPRMATCPRDNEPLMSTLRYPGAEFVCQVCGMRLGWLAPKPATWTQDLQDRHDALRIRFDAGDEPGSVEAA